MTKEKFIAYLESEGYFSTKEIPGRGYVGLCRFAFTIGLVYGLDVTGYEGRYCYSNLIDATIALATWTGEGDPQDDSWIKHKGYAGEYSNPLKNNTEI